MANLALKFVGLRDSSQCQPALFNPIILFALIGLLLSPLAARASSSSTSQSSEPSSTFYPSDNIISVVFSPDGQLLALEFSGSDSEFKLRDMSANSTIANFSTRGIARPTGTLSSDGQRLAGWNEWIGETIELWDVSHGGQHVATISAHETGIHGAVSMVSFSPDGQLLASGGASDTLVKLWDVSRGGQQVATFPLHDSQGLVVGLAFSPDGRLLASYGQFGPVILWDVSRGEQVATFPMPHDRNGLAGSGSGSSLLFSPDGRQLASAGQRWKRPLGDKEEEATTEVKLLDVSTGQSIATFSGDVPMSFSPSGRPLASASQETTRWFFDDKGEFEDQTTSGGQNIELWDVSTGQSIATLPLSDDLKELNQVPKALVFSPDGRLLASQHSSGVQLWDVSEWMPTPHKLTSSSGDDQESRAGTKLAEPFVVSVLDQYGSALSGAVVTFSVTAGGGTLSSTTATTDAKGRARSTLTLGSELGTNTVTATVAGLAAATFTATAVEQTPHSLTKVSGDGQGGRAGEPLAKPFIVSVLDQDGSAFAGAVVTFSVTAGGGTLSATTATTDAKGRAATRLTLGSDAETNTVRATVAGLAAVTFTATAITPHSLTKVSGDGQGGSASTQLAAPLVVSVLDQDSSPLAGVPVSFSVSAGGGMLSSTNADPCTVESSKSSVTTTTDARGRAATRLTLGSDAGTNTVAATVEGLEPATFTATATEQASPHRLTKVCGDSQEGAVSEPLAKPFVVSVSDEGGAAIAGVVVSFAVTAGGGTLSVASATTDANGRAATRLTLGSDAGSNTVTTTVEGLASATFTATGKKSGIASLFDLFNQSGKLVALPDRTQLLQNAPNPFNSQTVLSYFLLEPGPVRLEVFALSGQRVAVLQQGPQQAGYHRLHWDGRDAAGRSVASGTYLYRLVTDETVLTRKLVLLR